MQIVFYPAPFPRPRAIAQRTGGDDPMIRLALFSTFAATCLIMALSLLTSVLVARLLGPESRGVLLALTFWPGLWSALLNLSLNEATTYHLARCGSADSPHASSLESAGLLLQLAIAGGVTVATLALVFYFPAGGEESIPALLAYTICFVPLTILDQHFKAVLQGRGAFFRLNAIRLVQPLVYAASLAALALSRDFRVVTVMAAVIVSLGVSLLAGALSAGITLKGATVQAAKTTLASGWRFHKANVLFYAAAEVDKVLVLLLLSKVQVGYYAIALAVSMLGNGLIVQTLGTVLANQMPAADASAQGRLFVRSFYAATLALAAINGAAALLSPWWVPMLFGDAFSAAVPATIILLVMGALRGLRQVIDRAMRSTGNAIIGMSGEAAGFVGALIFATGGAWLAGLEGFSAGLCAAQAIALATMIVSSSRTLGIAPGQLSPLCPDNAHEVRQFARRELNILRLRWR